MFCSLLSSLGFRSVVADLQVRSNTRKKSFSEVALLSQITFVSSLISFSVLYCPYKIKFYSP